MNATGPGRGPASCTRWRRSPLTTPASPASQAYRPEVAGSVVRHLPQDLGVDVDVVQGCRGCRGAAAAARSRTARDHGVGEQAPRGAGTAASAGHRGSQVTSTPSGARQGEDVAGRRAPRAGRAPAARPAGTRRSRRSPGPPSRRRRRAGTRRRPAGATRSRRSGRGTGRSGRSGRPRRRRRPAPPTPTPGRSRRAARSRRRSPAAPAARRARCRCGSGCAASSGSARHSRVPVGAGRAVAHARAVEREEHLDPLVPAVGGALVEVGAGEGHAQEARAQPLQSGHLDGERPVGGDLQRLDGHGPSPGRRVDEARTYLG